MPYRIKYVKEYPFQGIVGDTASGYPAVFPTHMEHIDLYVDTDCYVTFDGSWATPTSGGTWIDTSVVGLYSTPDDVRSDRISIYAPSGQVTVRGVGWTGGSEL